MALHRAYFLWKQPSKVLEWKKNKPTDCSGIIISILVIISVFIYATNKVWLPPSVARHPAGAHQGFPPSRKVERMTNLESGRRKESWERQIFTQSQKKASLERLHFPCKGFWQLLRGHFSGKGPSSPRQNQHPQLRKIFQTVVLLRSN